MRSSFNTIAYATVLWCTVLLVPASAQSDAEIALKNARTAFANEQFEAARDLLEVASQTNGENPDIFLLLGKAHYQLGDVEAAIKAWQTTLKLAPEQAYARRMVAALEGQILDVDVRIAIVETLINEQQDSFALSEIHAIRRDSLTTAQTVKLLSFDAEIQIKMGQGGEALKALSELAIREPSQAGTPRTRLLTGRAKLALDSESIAEGLAILNAVKADFADTPEGAAADLALISLRLVQGDDAIAELADWMTGNPRHPGLHEARRTMVQAVSVFMEAAARQPKPNKDDPISAADSRMLAAAEYVLSSPMKADESLQLAQQIIAHIQSRWIANEAFSVGGEALERMLKIELPAPSRQAFATALTDAKNAAASKELDQIRLTIQEGEADAAVLANWIAAYPDHPRSVQARRTLVAAYLAQTQRGGNAREDTELRDSDKAAIAVAADLLDSIETTAEKSQLIQEVLVHLKTHYLDHGAHAAAIAGQQALLELSLPKQVQYLVWTALAEAQATAVLSRLESEVAKGTFKSGPLPNDLAALLQSFATINQEFPAAPSWQDQTAVGVSIAALSPRIPWPANVTQIQSTDSWALEFVLPVIAANHDPTSTDTATTVVDSIVERVAQVDQVSARGLASSTHQRLLDVLPEAHPLWPAAMIRQLNLRLADDASVFQENVETGRGQLNSELSNDSKSLLSLASNLIASQPNRAADVLALIEPFVSRRTESGHDMAAQSAFVLLEENLPPSQLRFVRLAVAQSWVNQVMEKHIKLLNDGFRPPEQLDEQLKMALVRCYELQSELQPNAAFVKSVQSLRLSIISHYRNLQYQETAAEAIEVKAEVPVDWLDALADFELASLRLSIAMDDLDDQTRKFQGRENITFTPAVKEAIAGLEKFISDRPTDRMVPGAIGRILSVGQRYEMYENYDVAAEIYTGLEAFATSQDALQYAEASTPTVAQQAAYAAASALHVKAAKALDLQTSNQSGGAEPPLELSNEFREAIAAYQAIITKFPDSPLVRSAIGKTMEIALHYANVGAWEVADSVYAELAAQELPLRQPEQLEFARALCELGKVIPDHARQVLAAIMLWEREVRTFEADGGAMLALGTKLDTSGNQFNSGFEGAFRGGRSGRNSGAEGLDLASKSEVELSLPQAASQPATATLEDPFAEGDAPAGKPGGEQISLADEARAYRETELLAAVRRQQSALTAQIAMLRDNEIRHVDRPASQGDQDQQEQQIQELVVPVLSEAEIARRQTILDAAYTKFQAIRLTYADSTVADHAREQIMVIVSHWQSIKQWERSAALVKRYLADNPTDMELPRLRLEVARDYLAWAAGAVQPNLSKQELLEKVNQRFSLAREELSGIIAAFADDENLAHQAQWDIANSHLSQARVVAGFSSTLARGQFVRAANELLATAELYHDHPQIDQIPNMLWNIAQELTSRGFYDEAITVWNEMTLHYPANPLAQQSALQIAQTYQERLRLPLRAVEAYLELNFSRGGDDVALQDSIFQIANQLMSEKRWVESLHVLETFVDSFPNHASAGQALTMIGQVHQTNEVWEDAIAAYRRVILEYDQGDWARRSKWSIAECTINLSRWDEAQGAYREYQKAYPEDPMFGEATARMAILKDLARFQKVVDEDGQRKSFDAQFQIGTIVRNSLANPVKAIIEYRKVSERWPESHLADDALFQVGMIYMELGQSESAREAFYATAERYPTSPLADDALFQVGASFEHEAEVLAGVTRGQAIEIANEVAQKQAYAVSQGNRRIQRAKTLDQIVQLEKEGKALEADRQTAFQAAQNVAFDQANAEVVSNWAAQQEEALTTAQLADRQDKINAALRKAVASFRSAASVASADTADDALLRMAQIYDQRLKDSDAAMSTWLEIVKQYSGTTVAEDASWKIAQYYETHEEYQDAIVAYNSFLRNYRRSPKASDAQAAIAENHEQLGNWVEAMDAYTNYINNYPEGTMASKAKEQIAWIKTYRL